MLTVLSRQVSEGREDVNRLTVAVSLIIEEAAVAVTAIVTECARRICWQQWPLAC